MVQPDPIDIINADELVAELDRMGLRAEVQLATQNIVNRRLREALADARARLNGEVPADG